MSKLIYLCSPCAPWGDITTKQNLAFIKKEAKKVMCLGSSHIPIVPHLFFSCILDESNEKDRRFGLNAGLEMLSKCNSLIGYVIDGYISKGMEGEIEYARSNGIRVDFMLVELLDFLERSKD